MRRSVFTARYGLGLEIQFPYSSHVFLQKHVTCWIKRDQLDVTCFIISLLNAQHVSDVNTSILRSLRLICWVISWVVLLWFDVCWCYVVVWLWWCGIRLQAEALVPQPSALCLRLVVLRHAHTHARCCINCINHVHSYIWVIRDLEIVIWTCGHFCLCNCRFLWTARSAFPLRVHDVYN